MIGEFLYGLTDKDALSAPVIQRAFNRNTLSQAAGTVQNTTFPAFPPSEKVALLTHVYAEGLAGAAQTVSSLNVSIRAPVAGGNAILQEVFHFVPPAAVLRQSFWMNTNILVMPGEFIQLIGVFSAGAAANTIILAVHGFFLPKGNLQFA